MSYRPFHEPNCKDNGINNFPPFEELINSDRTTQNLDSYCDLLFPQFDWERKLQTKTKI